MSEDNYNAPISGGEEDKTGNQRPEPHMTKQETKEYYLEIAGGDEQAAKNLEDADNYNW